MFFVILNLFFYKFWKGGVVFILGVRRFEYREVKLVF